MYIDDFVSKKQAVYCDHLSKSACSSCNIFQQLNLNFISPDQKVKMKLSISAYLLSWSGFIHW